MKSNVKLQIHTIDRIANKYASDKANVSGLRLAEVQVLRAVSVLGPMNQKQLAEYLLLDKAEITRTVTTLEKKGLIMRTAGKTDRREKIISPVERSLDIRNDTAEAEEQFYDWLLETESKEARCVFEQVLERMYLRALEGAKRGYGPVSGVNGK